jgi:hypothetical protein
LSRASQFNEHLKDGIPKIEPATNYGHRPGLRQALETGAGRALLEEAYRELSDESRRLEREFARLDAESLRHLQLGLAGGN